MRCRFVGYPILFVALLCGYDLATAQRTAGNSRDGARSPAVRPAESPAADAGSRTSGRTRTPEKPADPAPAPREGTGRHNEPPPAPPPQAQPSSGSPHHSGGGVDVVIDFPPDYPAPRGVWLLDGVSFGSNVMLGSIPSLPEYSGYDFSDAMKGPYDGLYADMCLEETENGDLVMSVRDDSEIMDIGLTQVPRDAIYIPPQGWSADRRVVVIPGHEYVVRTWDHSYAKFTVTSVMRDRASFDWAYQAARDGFAVTGARSSIIPR